MNAKSQMCLVGSMAAAFAVALFTTGCGTVELPPEPDPNDGTPLPSASVQKYETAAAESFLTVKTVSTFSGKGEGVEFNKNLLQAADAALVARGFRVANGTADIKVTLSPSVSVLDKTGEYVLMEGRADVAATLPGDANRQIASQSFAVKGERKLGADKAELDVAGKVAAQVKNWINGEVTVEKTGLVANNIGVKCKFHDVNDDPAFVSQFISAAKSMKGVVDCSLASQDNNARRFEFRTIYRKSSFPGGFLNALIVQHPELNLVWGK